MEVDLVLAGSGRSRARWVRVCLTGRFASLGLLSRSRPTKRGSSLVYQTGHTIEKTLDQIHRHDLVLPAIQREFVWHPEQIGRLFDSLMQGYPFGTFLYWRVDAENSGKFKFYDFVLDYHERDDPHCTQLGSSSTVGK